MERETGAGVDRKATAGVAVLCVIAASLMVALGSTLAGCTSEADLVQILSTTEDSAAREKAARDLAKRYSFEATEQLAAAAEADATAAAGLDCLAEAYGALVCEEADRSMQPEEKGLSKEMSVQLQGALSCLGCMGTDEAVAQLITVGTDLDDDASLNILRRTAAKELAQTGEPALERLMAIAADDEWARGVLANMGDDAVPVLLEALAEEKWCEAVLADIGEPAIDLVVAHLSSEDSLAVHRAIGVLLRMYDDYEPGVDAVLLTSEMAPVLLGDLANKGFDEENQVTEAEDGFAHEDMAQYALADTGEPAVDFVLASSYEEKWLILEMMGAEAVPALTTTMNGKSRVDAFFAAATLVYIGEYSSAAVKWFTDALENKDLKTIADNYLYYIALGEEGSEQTIADALLKHGTKQMALDCLNCGNEELDAAARKWASRHGYIVYKSSKQTQAVLQWGI